MSRCRAHSKVTKQLNHLMPAPSMTCPVVSIPASSPQARVARKLVAAFLSASWPAVSIASPFAFVRPHQSAGREPCFAPSSKLPPPAVLARQVRWPRICATP
eukprot:scaffold20255_cov34-Tisochrysis_lutea.AAC.2